MKSWGSTGITVLIVLVISMLVAITAASVISTETTDTTTEEDYEQMLEDAANEVSRYLLVKDQLGRFNEDQQIEKIVLWLTPLVEQDIDISQLTIELNNGESVMMLTYSGSNPRESNDIFEQSIWDDIDGTNFGLIPVIDLDDSLVNNNAFDDASDNAYLVFKLPTGMMMNKYDEMVVKLVPSSGIARTLYLKAPMPMKSIVEL